MGVGEIQTDYYDRPHQAMTDLHVHLQRELDLQLESERSGTEFIRFWEVREPCVVLGRGSSLESEVHTRACEADNVPVVRRSSGGGSVLLVPGCLNYSLILDLDRTPRLRDVERSYVEILSAVCRSVGDSGVKPIGSDLTKSGRKFGGCSQKRSRKTLLHHGTILYNFDVSLAARYLQMPPPRSPAYRLGRSHADFLTNVSLPSDFQLRLAAEYPGIKVVE
jgi:lipoate-protein ligase A